MPDTCPKKRRQLFAEKTYRAKDIGVGVAPHGQYEAPARELLANHQVFALAVQKMRRSVRRSSRFRCRPILDVSSARRKSLARAEGASTTVSGNMQTVSNPETNKTKRTFIAHRGGKSGGTNYKVFG
jgi:hypothetical protein